MLRGAQEAPLRRVQIFCSPSHVFSLLLRLLRPSLPSIKNKNRITITTIITTEHLACLLSVWLCKCVLKHVRRDANHLSHAKPPPR